LTPDEVLSVHRNRFYKALTEGDYESLRDLYVDDYIVVRSDGSALTKAEVLTDLMRNGLKFTSIDLSEENVRIYGGAAIITGESRTEFVRNGVAGSSRFRMVAVYVQVAGSLKLAHFQSTGLN
jgi:ketosteroid isomerase-like protein